MGGGEIRKWTRRRLGAAGRRGASESSTRARYGHGGSGEDRQECEELPEEGDGQKEKMDGTGDEDAMHD